MHGGYGGYGVLTLPYTAWWLVGHNHVVCGVVVASWQRWHMHVHAYASYRSVGVVRVGTWATSCGAWPTHPSHMPCIRPMHACMHTQERWHMHYYTPLAPWPWLAPPTVAWGCGML